MPAPTLTQQHVFYYGAYNYGEFASMIDMGYTMSTASAKTPGRAGGHHGIARPVDRRITVKGTITAISRSALRNEIDALNAAHASPRPQMLIIEGNRWVWATVDGQVQYTHDNLLRQEYTIDMIAHDPYIYESDINNIGNPVVLLSFANSGTVESEPLMTIRVGAITTPGTSYVEMVNNEWLNRYGVSQSFRLYPTIPNANYYVFMGRNVTIDDDKNWYGGNKVVVGSIASLPFDISENKSKRGSNLVILPGFNSFLETLSGVTLTGNTSLEYYRRYL
jgi:hypothetical protein